MDKLLTLITERPMFHMAETQGNRSFAATEKFPRGNEIQKMERDKLVCASLETPVVAGMQLSFVRSVPVTLNTN